MTDAMRIEVPPTAREREEEMVTLDRLVEAFEQLDDQIHNELIAGGDFLAAARRAHEARIRVCRFIAERPGLRVARRLAPALKKIRARAGYHVDEFSPVLRQADLAEVDWDELVFVDGAGDHRFFYEGLA